MNHNRTTFLDQLRKRGMSMDIIPGNHDTFYKNTNELINLISSIDIESITLCLQNRSIELKDIDLFSSTDRKLLKELNIYSATSLLTLQDLIFNYHKLVDTLPPHLLEIIDQIQYVCSLPLSQFPDLNTHDVEILNNNEIFYNFKYKKETVDSLMSSH